MLLGFPAAVQPGDDDKAHIQSLEGFVQRDVQTGEGRITPEVARLILQHGGEHDNALAQKGDPNLNQIRRVNATDDPISGTDSCIATQMPSNVVPGPGGAGTGTTRRQLRPRAAAAVKTRSRTPRGDERAGDTEESGVPITDEEVNEALQRAGLPPLQAGMPIPSRDET